MVWGNQHGTFIINSALCSNDLIFVMKNNLLVYLLNKLCQPYCRSVCFVMEEALCCPFSGKSGQYY